jgi:hypothetical protein
LGLAVQVQAVEMVLQELHHHLIQYHL